MQQKGPVNLFVQLLQQRSNSEHVSQNVESRCAGHGSFLYADHCFLRNARRSKDMIYDFNSTFLVFIIELC